MIGSAFLTFGLPVFPTLLRYSCRPAGAARLTHPTVSAARALVA